MTTVIKTAAIQQGGTTKTCAAPGCNETVNTDTSHRFGVGIYHYTGIQKGPMTFSYAQIFNTLHSCSRNCAETAIKNRIDNHDKIPFGSYDPAVHNPDGDHADSAISGNVEYNTDGIWAKTNLPKIDAVTGQSLAKANDIFIPAVDDSSRGICYQAILKKQYPDATLEQLTLGTSSLANAQILAKAIIDEIIKPDHLAEQSRLAAELAAQQAADQAATEEGQ